MEQIDYILDFVAHLGREMLECGANLERVKLSMELVCKKYGLTEISIFALNSHISISARQYGQPAKVREVAVPYNGIHLDRLRRLNDLSYKVCEEKPEAEELEDMLYEALLVPGYTTWQLIAGYLIAMNSLCLIFGGKWQEMVVVSISTCIIFALSQRMAREQINHIVSNAVCMFAAGAVAIFATYIHFVHDFFSVIITNAFFLIPGIPMVNAVRNLLCGNEMNGLLELLKVLLEGLSIVAGLFIAYFLFGRHVALF